MAVYTSINIDEISSFLNSYNLPDLKSFKGISSGVTNTNYVIETIDAKYILTIFEQAQPKDIQYYVDLMSFLSNKKYHCPTPIQNQEGFHLGEIKNKPALLVSLLSGRELKSVSNDNCFAVGVSLAQMHQLTQDYKVFIANPRGLNWMNRVFDEIHPLLSNDEVEIIRDELIFLDQNFNSNLPSGIIHADLFKDNVLFYNHNVSGVIDFYYACYDLYIYDIAIALNDWCINEFFLIDAEKKRYFLNGYESIRELSEDEKNFLPISLRLAAMRFWLSRLYDFHFKKDGEITYTKAPEHFKKILQNYQRS